MFKKKEKPFIVKKTPFSHTAALSLLLAGVAAIATASILLPREDPATFRLFHASQRRLMDRPSHECRDYPFASAAHCRDFIAANREALTAIFSAPAAPAPQQELSQLPQPYRGDAN